MTAPDNGDPYRIMRDAAARTEMVLASVSERHESGVASAYEIRATIREEVAALKAARTLAESRAKLAAPDMGGCVLDLSDPEEARAVREALRDRAAYFDRDGQHNVAALALRIRKRINAGVVRNCERRTEAGK